VGKGEPTCTEAQSKQGKRPLIEKPVPGQHVGREPVFAFGVKHPRADNATKMRTRSIGQIQHKRGEEKSESQTKDKKVAEAALLAGTH
jgi:hypothetical protein